MVICPNCRSETEAEARYCGTCGCRIEQNPPATQVQAGSREPAQREQYAHTAAPSYHQQHGQQQYPQYQQHGQPPQQYQRYQPPEQYPAYPYYYGQMKNSGVAVVLALVLGVFGLMGVGHLYVGKLTRGFIILAVGIILTVMIWASFFLGFTTSGLFWIAGMIAGVALIILWVWQTYDAYRLANEYNAVVQRTGRPAW